MSELSQKKKKSIFKRWWFWLLVVVIIIVYAASQGGSNQPKQVSGSTSSPDASVAQSAPSATPEKTEFAIGEKVQLKDNMLVVQKVEKSAGTEFEKPKSGNEYVVVSVHIENAGKDKISYNPFDFKMLNSQGQIIDGTFSTINQDTALQSGDLAPGGKVSGTLIFEEPKADAKLQLQYQPSFWSDKTIKVNLQ